MSTKKHHALSALPLLLAAIVALPVSAAGNITPEQQACVNHFKAIVEITAGQLVRRAIALKDYRSYLAGMAWNHRTQEDVDGMLPPELTFDELIKKEWLSAGSSTIYQPNGIYWSSGIERGKLAHYVQGRGDPTNCTLGLNVVSAENPDLELVAVFMPPYKGLEPMSALVSNKFLLREPIWNWGLDPKATQWAKENLPRLFQKFWDHTYKGRDYGDQVIWNKKGGMARATATTASDS